MIFAEHAQPHEVTGEVVGITLYAGYPGPDAHELDLGKPVFRPVAHLRLTAGGREALIGALRAPVEGVKR